MPWTSGCMNWTSHLHNQARYARIKYILFIAIHQLLWAFVLWFVDLLRSSFVVVRFLFDYSAGIVPDTGGCCDMRYPPGTHLNSSSSGQNGRHFADDIFKCYTWMKSFIFRFEIHWVCSQGSNWQYSNIGPDDGLAPARRQAIIWTNADPVHRLIYAALRGDGLNLALVKSHLDITMMTSSNGKIFRVTGHLHKSQWHRALMVSLICIWINGWVNNREAGDMRRYRAHYDVTLMTYFSVSVKLFWNEQLTRI